MTSTTPAGIAYLDGRRLRRLLLAGIARLARERGHLDRINVFPVPDGDTGTNLTLTFGAVADRLAGLDTSHCGELFAAAADAALDGARGNSGAIFAQYFQGLADASTGTERLEAGDLGRLLATGADYARSALEDPKEGTVLTVMDAIAAAVSPGRWPGGTDFALVLPALLTAAREAVASTRTTLEVMEAAGVEDAGALGLLLIFEGMAAGLEPGRAAAVPQTPEPDLALRDHVDAAHRGPLVHRYCTECLVAGEGMDQTRLRQELAAVGSSLVVVGGARKLRIHIHVNVPEEAFAIARRYGQVTAEKADDMARQERTLLADGRRVAIMADSGADLPAELWDEYGVQLVPLRVNFGDRSYLDKTGLGPAEFFRQLRASPVHPRTSQPPPGDFRRAYELLSSHFEHVVCISLAGALSGTHQAALAAATRISRPGQVTVVDSCTASVGQGLVVLWAAEQARQGLPPEAVIASIRDCLNRTRTYGFVPDLSYAVRGGRLPNPWRWLAARLPLSFVISMAPPGGVRVRRVLSRGAGRTGAGREALLRTALKETRTGVPHRLAIAHGDCAGEAEALREACLARFPGLTEVLVTALSPVFGVHGGPGTLALAVQEQPSAGAR